jgi:hypothetical protein
MAEEAQKLEVLQGQMMQLQAEMATRAEMTRLQVAQGETRTEMQNARAAIDQLTQLVKNFIADGSSPARGQKNYGSGSLILSLLPTVGVVASRLDLTLMRASNKNPSDWSFHVLMVMTRRHGVVGQSSYSTSMIPQMRSAYPSLH